MLAEQAANLLTGVAVAAPPVVLITGASRGIGLELARTYAQAGHAIYATCRAPQAATELSALAANFQQVTIMQLDAGDHAQITQIVAETAHAPPEIVICNAVHARRERSFAALEPEDWITAMRVNALSIITFAQALLPIWRSTIPAKLISIGSTMGLLDDADGPGRLTYRSSKAALTMIVRVLAAELAPHGIGCFAVHPGWVKTALGGPSAPLLPAVVAKDIAALVGNPSDQLNGHLVDRFGTRLN